ncbi:hypothetical protein CC86DRAFT_385446 [Ophiobolus disseminans]|uniref:Uncharacterized protein n=1 Tax=Ophiobolus disseminans TaxID=1469910 RepID=A0A6A6ZQG6_9PLEO|nr:hypothetical protein CC86DRAFT_385446 [Ophiobolus disseminans]
MVIEDEESLAGADTHTVRHAFRTWIADDLTPRLCDPESYGGIEKAHSNLLGNDNYNSNYPARCIAPRWQFCLLVDDACLSSLKLRGSRSPFVKIVDAQFQEDRVAVVDDGREDGETDDQCEYVGWMYMDVGDYVQMYDGLSGGYWRDLVYQRPEKGYADH